MWTKFSLYSYIYLMLIILQSEKLHVHKLNYKYILMLDLKLSFFGGLDKIMFNSNFLLTINVAFF